MSGEIHSGVQIVQEPSITITSNDSDDDLKACIKIDDYATKSLACDVCNVKVTSVKILQRHLEGRKHKLRVERTGKCYRCDLCDITANSETQLNIHLNSSKHKARILRQEYSEFTDISTSSKGIWILIFCIICLFINLVLLFKVVL